MAGSFDGARGSDRDGIRRFLGIDLGEKRIGIAVGDLDAGSASPLLTLMRGKTVAHDATALARLAAEQRIGGLVVGLPLDMDGTEGAQAVKTREWADEIATLTGLPLRFRDERLTSERAERRIGGTARGRSGGPPTRGQREAYRARVDREAAALILQDEFDAMAAEDAQRRSS
jgi:putative Holliday junction resolvase